jgi:hypothetical protein
MATEKELVTYHGGCHCGAIQYEYTVPRIEAPLDCNCALCTKVSNTTSRYHFPKPFPCRAQPPPSHHLHSSPPNHPRD